MKELGIEQIPPRIAKQAGEKIIIIPTNCTNFLCKPCGGLTTTMKYPSLHQKLIIIFIDFSIISI